MTETTADAPVETKKEEAEKKPAPKPKPAAKKTKPNIWSRRDFYTNFGWFSFLAATLGAVLYSVRFLFPRVLYEPPAAFKAGYPDEYPLGTVSTKWQAEFRTVLVRQPNGDFYAIFLKCTHLGCTPRWLGPEDKFKCGCHGSGFRRSGINYEGPAPRALERFEVALADDGQILINRGRKFIYEKGEWEKSVLSV